MRTTTKAPDDGLRGTINKGDLLLIEKVPKKQWQDIQDLSAYIICTSEKRLIRRLHRLKERVFVALCDNDGGNHQVRISFEEIEELWIVKSVLNGTEKDIEEITPRIKFSN